MAKAKPSRTKALPKIDVRVDPKLKALFDQHMKVLHDAQGEGAVAFDRLWESVDAIVNHEPPLYVVGGYASADAFFAGALKETSRTAQRNIRVARFATPEHETKYGIATLDAVLGYLQSKAGAPLSGHHPIDFDRVRIPIGGHVRSLDKLTVRDIQAATAKLTDGAHAKPKSDVLRAVGAALAAEKPLADVEVHEHAGFMSFARVPASALQHFGNAVIRGAGKVPSK